MNKIDQLLWLINNNGCGGLPCVNCYFWSDNSNPSHCKICNNYKDYDSRIGMTNDSTLSEAKSELKKLRLQKLNRINGN